MTLQPHFQIPFRFDAYSAIPVNEQNTLDEIAACIEVITRFPKGSLEAMPTFGITYPEFSERIDTERMKAEILEWEPRADLLFEAKPELVDNHIQRITASIAIGGRDG